MRSATIRPALGLLGDVGLTPSDLVEVAVAAEDAGFGGVRVIEYEYDSLALVQALATATRRLTVGPSVARYFARHPVQLAETATAIDLLAPGRLVLGLGSGPNRRAGAAGPQRWGQPADREVGRLREYVEVVRRLLTGDPVRQDGEFYRFDELTLRPRPSSARVPVWLAAGGDLTARLAGRVGDGLYLQFAHRAGARRTVGTARRAAHEAGRDPDALQVGNLVMTCVDDDRATARRAMRAHLVNWYLHQPRLQDVLAGAGHADAMAAIRAADPPHDTRDGAATLLADDRVRRAADAVPDALLDEYTIAGTPADLREGVRRYAGQGVDVPVLYAFPAGDDWAAGYRAVVTAGAGLT